MLGAWDVALFRWINGGWSSPLLDPVFAFLSVGIKSTALKVAFGGILITYLCAGAKARAAAVQVMIAWPLANGITEVFKHQLPSLRPCAELPGVVAVHGVPFLTSPGTLSAHSANMAAVAAVMVLRLKWHGLPWVAFALLTGLSRVYVGVHYPSQVALGWLAGTIAGWVVVKTWDAFVSRRSGSISPASPESSAAP
jgi:undecaprenyl-diphosphatase